MTKQWQTQSDQHDGIIQIKGYFYSSSTFSELKTKNKKKKEKRNPTMLVSYIYKKKEGKKRSKTFHIHDCVLKSLVFEREGGKVLLSHCESISLRIHTHIYPPVQPVCGMCRYRLTVQLDPTRRPLPTHHTDIHRPLKQDVQKLVFNIKQCRALT